MTRPSALAFIQRHNELIQPFDLGFNPVITKNLANSEINGTIPVPSTLHALGVVRFVP
jgi:hypothetical protein